MKAIIVDRDWDTRESLKKKFEARGVEVYTAENAEEALNLCIIVDVNWVITSSILPEMSGITLIERIRNGRKDLEISTVLLENREDNIANSLNRQLGVNSILRKPVSEEKLDQCLGKGVFYSGINL